MKMQSIHAMHTRTLTAALATILLGGAMVASAADPVPGTVPVPAAEVKPGEPPPPPPEPINPRAKELLDRMATTLGGAKSYTVTMRSSYDAVQPDGSTVSFSDRRKVSLQRPDKLRIDVMHSDGDETTTFYDGKNVTVWVPSDKGYAQVPAPKTTDGTVAFLVGELRQRVPLAMMFTSRIKEELDTRVVELRYVERSFACGDASPCHHLLARSKDIDFQAWLEDTPQALPRRVYITYIGVPGEPQFRADLSEWNLSPTIPASTFAFTPPKDAIRVPFAVPAPEPDPKAQPDGEAGAKPGAAGAQQ